MKEKFEDIREYNGRNKKTNNGLQNTT